MKKLIFGLIILSFVAIAGTVTFAPATVFELAMNGTRAAANMALHDIKLEEYNYTYLDTGADESKPTILMIHGFSADKDNWPRMAYYLKDQYRLVALDLLGHGDSDKPIDADYRISTQVARVHNFAHSIGLKQFHLIGNSMGGQISGAYAAHHPEDVLSVTLLNNGGIISPTPSDMWVSITNGEGNPLIMESPDDADAFFEYIFVNPPFMTDGIKRLYAERSMARKALNEHIFAYLKDDNFENLELDLPKITAPVQIIWGKEDRVLHYSSIEKMTPLLNNARVVVMENIGHAPMMEAPEETARLLAEFIQTTN